MTMHIPYEYWYQDTGLNPRGYLDLDYPPLAGMLHIILGKYVTNAIIPESIRLTTLDRYQGNPAKGYPGQIEVDPYAQEQYINEKGVLVFPLHSSNFYKSHKYFVVNRVSFALLDLLMMAPATFILVQYLWRRMNPRLRSVMFLVLNSIPMTVYFDIANTQINFLSMSLFLLSYRFLISQHFALSSSLAVLTVLSKQTSLILFLPYTIFVLSKLWTRLSTGTTILTILFYLLKIALSATATFLFVLFPFLDSQTLRGLQKHIMPFGEPLIAQPLPTVWYLIDSLIYKFPTDLTQTWYHSWLPTLCSVIILVFSFPGLYKLFRTPSISNLNLAMQQCILLFFFFGYRTHEKTINWYILVLNLSTFEFLSSIVSSVNLMTIFILRPMIAEYQRYFVASFLFVLNLWTHYVLASLPLKSRPANGKLCSKLPSFLKSLAPLFQFYVASYTVMYYTHRGVLMDRTVDAVYQKMKYIFFILVWLGIYHFAMMSRTLKDVTQPFFFDFHLKND